MFCLYTHALYLTCPMTLPFPLQAHKCCVCECAQKDACRACQLHAPRLCLGWITGCTNILPGKLRLQIHSVCSLFLSASANLVCKHLHADYTTANTLARATNSRYLDPTALNPSSSDPNQDGGALPAQSSCGQWLTSRCPLPGWLAPCHVSAPPPPPCSGQNLQS